MRETSLLKLDRVDPALDLPKELTVDDILQELLEVDLKDPSCDVRPVVGLLFRVKVLLDLLPFGVAGESDEEVGLSFVDNDSHRIMVSLSHVPLTSLEG